MIQQAAILAAAIALGAGFTTAGVQTVRLANARTELAALRLEIADANTRAANQATALQAAVTKAQNEAKTRENALRAAAAGAAADADGLRDQLAASREQYAQLSREAVIERATAVGAVLEECSRRYSGLAAKADRHANDVRTLMEAWPR